MVSDTYDHVILDLYLDDSNVIYIFMSTNRISVEMSSILMQIRSNIFLIKAIFTRID